MMRQNAETFGETPLNSKRETPNLKPIPGFTAAGIACGLKKSGKKDIALILSDRPCTFAATFTQNIFAAAPVQFDRELLAKTQGEGLRALIVNAGNANAVTGEQGLRDAEAMARHTESTLGLPADSVFVMSTGVIGHPMPMDVVTAGISTAATALSADGFSAARSAIMTTDLVPKSAVIEQNIGGRKIHIAGMTKGSGMIHPNMATMLGAIFTTAPIAAADFQSILRRAVAVSFNRISVDGDTSTNDTVLAMANGAAGGENLSGADLDAFADALTDVCVSLAKQIARDGEGATKLVEINVTGAQSEADAVRAAETIATSPLSKTAIFGNDPNWGRFLAAVGRSGAQVDPNRAELWLSAGETRTQLVSAGQPIPFDADTLSQAMHAATDIFIEVDLGAGDANATYWTCDFSYKYVEINAEYHT